jgi:hypothetical protein
MRVIPVLTAVLAGVLTFASSGAQAAAPVQALGVVLHSDAAATERLPFYRTAAPITVNVGGDAARLPSLTLTARAPSGASVTRTLARTGNTFSGKLRLVAPGAWTLAFSTEFGTALATVPLDVVTEDAADFAAWCAFALSALSVVAGLALILGVARRPSYVRIRS